MQDLKLPVLLARVVSGLTGLSPQALRRLSIKGIPLGARRGTGRAAAGPGRRYSWREVEQLQRASHLLRTTRLSPEEIRQLLARSRAASTRAGWIVARRTPPLRRRRPPVRRARSARGRWDGLGRSAGPLRAPR